MRVWGWLLSCIGLGCSFCLRIFFLAYNHDFDYRALFFGLGRGIPLPQGKAFTNGVCHRARVVSCIRMSGKFMHELHMGVAQDVKDVFRGHGHGHKTETATAGRGTGVGTGYASLNNYNFAEGALQLRGEHYEVCDSKTFVVVEVQSLHIFDKVFFVQCLETLVAVEGTVSGDLCCCGGTAAPSGFLFSFRCFLAVLAR